MINGTFRQGCHSLVFFSKKAKKIDEIFTVDLTNTVKLKVKILSIFVAYKIWSLLFATHSITHFSSIQLAMSKAGCIAVNFCLDQTTICPAVYSEFFLLEKVGHSMKLLWWFLSYTKKEKHMLYSNFWTSKC